MATAAFTKYYSFIDELAKAGHNLATAVRRMEILIDAAGVAADPGFADEANGDLN